MTTFDAASMSPVPAPAADAQSPGPFHGIYGMPMFVTVPTDDLAATVLFWTEGLGFFDLFSVPGRLTHLRRWAFQDVLVVPSAAADAVPSGAVDAAPSGSVDAAPSGAVGTSPSTSVSFSCVLSEIAPARDRCEALLPGSTTGPHDTPWNAVELAVLTPERTRVVLTAAKPYDAARPVAETLAAMGITPSG
ncbi:hypothetical protein [Georgenia sp. SUBG003]|uniref:hypothetical protein n=1 Tax=Georgenia sp. SUBG003 TaxID=1497974 RepID=UPI0004DA96E8|nr:glycosyltransferase [Georgenia sp. SUBG003]